MKNIDKNEFGIETDFEEVKNPIKEIFKNNSVRLVEKCNVRWECHLNEAKDDAEMYCGDCDYNLDYGAEDWNYCPNCGLKLVYRDECEILD